MFPIFSFSYTYIFCIHPVEGCGRDSIVGIATRYGLDSPVIESWCRRDFSCLQTGPQAHPASCTMGTGYFLGVKRQGVMLRNCCLLAPCCEWFGGIPTPAVCATYACHGVTFYQYEVLFVTIPYYIHL